MREVRMPVIEPRIVTIPDNQCGEPVSVWYGDYHPCNAERGHEGEHALGMECPNVFEHPMSEQNQKCIRHRFHPGVCRSRQHVADIFGEGDDERESSNPPTKALEPWHIVEGVQSEYMEQAAKSGTPLVAMCGKSWVPTQHNVEQARAEDLCPSCSQHFVISITQGARGTTVYSKPN